MRPDLRLQARVPSSDATPSEPLHLEWDVSGTIVTDSGNGIIYAGFGLTDAIKTNCNKVLTAAASGVLTWSSASHPYQANLATYLEQYRVVSAGMKFQNNALVSNNGGRIYMLQNIADTAATVDPNNAADFQIGGTRVRELSLNDIEQVPFLQMMPATGAATSGVAPIASNAWHYIQNTAASTGIYFLIVLPQSTSQSVMARMYYNLEVNALLENQYIIPQSVAIGDDSHRASALRAAGSLLETWDGDMASLERLMSRAGAVATGLKSGYNWMAGMAGSLFGKKRAYHQTIYYTLELLDAADPQGAPARKDIREWAERELNSALMAEGRHLVSSVPQNKPLAEEKRDDGYYLVRK